MLLMVTWVPLVVCAQESGGSGDVRPVGDALEMIATRTDEPPVLDGFVDDMAWELAVPIGDFRQREPRSGMPASERTEVRILYDDENLYIAFVLYDRDPDEIIATQLRRDDRMRTDDTMAILLDTYHDHRNAFLFRVNALGTKYDATLTGETQINSQWDEVWESAAQITERGWEAELVIPFKILRYPTGTHIWGVDFKREIRRRNEEDNWSNFSRDYLFNAIHLGGTLVGLENLKLRDRFRLKPYVTGGYDRFAQGGDPSSSGRGDIGIEDFKIQITPNLTSDLTFNTDFAQVEADDQRVNLTRFSLFFPEKREFFLEGANNFTFGAERQRFSFAPPHVLLYHSRTIGLSGGDPIPILYGAKVTGKIGGGSVGLLNMQTRDSEFGAGQNFSVARWRQDILARSSVGAVFTNVQGDGEFNRVAGLDVNFRLFEYLTLSSFAAAASDSRVDGARWSGQVRANWTTDAWDATADIIYVDEDFNSDLGFVLRRDIIRHSYGGSWKPRPSWAAVRQVWVSADVEYITDTDGRLLDRRQSMGMWWRLESGDSVNLTGARVFRRLDYDFEIHPGVIVPAGDYSFDSATLSLTAYEGRRVNGTITIQAGEFYDGTRFSVGGGPKIRFNQKLSLEPSYSYNHVDLASGSFNTHVGRVRAKYSFSEKWLTDGLVQYDTVSDQATVYARLRYIYRTGNDFYLVYRQARAYGGEHAGAVDRSLTAKLTYSLNW